MKYYEVELNNDRENKIVVIIKAISFEVAEEIAELIISGRIDKYDFTDM